MYGREIREAFAIAYARRGNATKALIQVLGKERASKMQLHTLRAKASTLLNDYRTVAMIEQEKSAMLKRGDYLPRYRLRTYRAELRADYLKMKKRSPSKTSHSADKKQK